MKRAKLIKYLMQNDCLFYREGANHTLYYHLETNQVTAVPRHNEIGDLFCNEICKQLGIPKIK